MANTPKYANHIGYSDVTPYEVTRVISNKTLEVRRMKCTRDESFTPEFVIGGFLAHCTNQRDQEWIIESDPTERVERIRLHKNGQWKNAHGARFTIADAPVRFYDYNF